MESNKNLKVIGIAFLGVSIILGALYLIANKNKKDDKPKPVAHVTGKKF